MPPKIRFYCNIEKIRTYSGRSGQLYGMNISIAADLNGTPVADVLPMVMPWKSVFASPGQPPQFVVKSGAGMWSSPRQSELSPAPLDPASLTLLRAEYEKRLGARVEQDPNYLDPPPVSGGRPLDQNGRRWMSLLADLGTRPAPVAQGMFAAMYFSAAPADEPTLRAAPVLDRMAYDMTQGSLLPRNTQATPNSDVWEYETPDDRMIIEVQIRFPQYGDLDLLLSGGYWLKRPATWIYQSDPTMMGHREWQEQQHHNVPRRILEAARAGDGLGFTKREFESVFFESLRRQLTSPVPNNPQAAVTAATATTDARLWRDSVQRVTPKSVPVSLDEAADGPLLAEHLDVLDAIEESLRKEESLNRLKADLTVMPSPPLQVTAKENFRAYWNRIVNSPDMYKAIDDEGRQWEAQAIFPAGITMTSAAQSSRRRLLDQLQRSPITPKQTVSLTSGPAPGSLPVAVIPPFSPTSYAHSFAIPVGTPLTTGSSTQLDLARVAPMIAGYGLMVRAATVDAADPPEDSFTPWRCANVVYVYFEISKMPIHNSVVAPERANLKYGMQQQVLFYDAAAKSALGPRAKLANGVSADCSTPDYSDKQRLLDEAIVSYGQVQRMTPGVPNPPPLPEDWASQLPALKFGRVIEGAIFLIPNTGALPRELSGNSPGELQAFYSNPKPNIPPESRYRELYLRRVGIGAPEPYVPGPPQPNPAPPVPAEETASARAERIKHPTLATELDLVPLDRELDRDVLFGENAKNAYFSQLPGRGQEEPARDGPGTLNLPADGWSIVIAGIDCPSRMSTPLVFRVVHKETQIETMEVQVSRHGSTVTATVVNGDATARITTNTFFDFHFEMLASGVYFVSLIPRDRLFVEPSAGNKTVSQPQNVTAANFNLSRLELSCADTGNNAVSYRRPQIAVRANTIGDQAQQTPAPDCEHYLFGPPEMARLSDGTTYVPNEHTLRFRRPPTEVFTWDRWHRWCDTTETDRRRDLLIQFFKNGQSGDSTEQKLVDDPAVAHLYFELIPVWTNGNADAVPSNWWGRASTNKFLRSDHEEFHITFVSNGTARMPSTQLEAHKVEIKAGEIWEFRAHSAVPLAEFAASGRLHPGMVREGGATSYSHDTVTQRIVSHDNQQFVLFGPTRYRLEAVPAPEDQDLSDTIRHAIRLEWNKENPNRVTAKLDKSLLPDSFWAYVDRAEFTLQEWRWMGRPIRDAFPFAAVNPDGNGGQDSAANEALLKRWEDKGGFNGREDTDLRVFPSRFGIYDISPILWSEDVSGNLGALYYRCRLTVKSRYANLSTTFSRLFPQGDETDWRRLFVPCRQTEPAPKPVIRIVIPLTQAADWRDRSSNDLPSNDLPHEPGGSPGLLVLCAERWFGFGGLNEFLEAEVVSTRNEYREPYHHDRYRPDYYLNEVGYDPLLTDRAVLSQAQFSGDSIVGPTGHTLDVGLKAPIFRGCSFILKLPPELGRENSGKYWPMALVKFRRAVEAAGTVHVVPTREERLDSEWTTASWVQFLPDSFRHFGDVVPENLSFSLPDRKLVFVPAAGSDPVRFERPQRGDLWVLVTEQISNAFGIDEEKFFDLFSLNDDLRTFDKMGLGLSAPPSKARARLLEVQKSPVAPTNVTGQNLCAELFFPEDKNPSNPRGDSTIRIVAVSKSIDRKQDPSRV